MQHRRWSNQNTSEGADTDADAHEPPAGALPGIVIRSHGLWHEVTPLAGGDTVIATVRGQLKRHRRGTDPVAVGDRVWATPLPDNEAVIEFIEPRRRTLGRIARHTRDVEQVILANPDQVLFVFACRQPEPHVRMLDRFIILAERQEIPIFIVVSKMDLDEPGDSSARARFSDYERAFPVLYVSAHTGEGIENLRVLLSHKISAVAGPSGVGKSRLLNVLDPASDRKVGDVSAATGKGRHTTVGARLHDLGDGAFVADTPGMRALTMVAVPQEELDWSYRELRPYLGICRYPDCRHVHEPDCAVREAVERGDIARARYESYVALRTGDEVALNSDW